MKHFTWIILLGILLVGSCSTKIENEKNVIPVATFQMSAEKGTLKTVFSFDASVSIVDDKSLQIRWDFENDGEWDTEYSTEMKINHQYLIPGEKTVKLEVKDESGKIHQHTKTLEVLHVIHVSSNASTTMIVLNDGSLWAVGSNLGIDKNINGILGTGTVESYSEFVKIMDNVESVDLGQFHTTILKEDKTLWVSGENTSGELGNGSSLDHIQTEFVKVLDDVASISVGWFDNFALKTDGTLWASGSNVFGSHGNNKRLLPIPLYSKVLQDVEIMSHGFLHSMVRKKMEQYGYLATIEMANLG